MKTQVWVLLLLVGLAACTSAEPTLQPTLALLPSTNTPVPAPTIDVIEPTVPGPQDVVATEVEAVPVVQTIIGRAVADLADALGVDMSEIVVSTVQEVRWDDASLGCGGDAEPQETPGYLIMLAHDGISYTYHTDMGRALAVCDSLAGETVGQPVIIDTQLQAMVDVARRNLAQRLDLPLRRVFAVEAYAVQWTDRSLGCALDDEAVEPGRVTGYRIVLRVGPETYAYHSDYRQVVYCPEEASQYPGTEPNLELETTPAASAE